jgi:type IV pilus biogenesis protein CpaD/CtpE
MKQKKTLVSAALLLAASLGLPGCMATDAMFGDFDRAPAHATDRYPIKVTHTKQGAKAEVATCGNWKEDLTDTDQNRPWPNMGCAIQHNIAAEVADPETLDKPRVASVKDSEDGVGAVVRQQGRVNTTTLPGNYTYAP